MALTCEAQVVMKNCRQYSRERERESSHVLAEHDLIDKSYSNIFSGYAYTWWPFGMFYFKIN